MFRIPGTGLSRAHGSVNPGQKGEDCECVTPPSQRALYLPVGAETVRIVREVDGEGDMVLSCPLSGSQFAYV